MPKISHVYKDKERGTYYAVASLGFDDITGKRIQKKKTGFTSQVEAQKWYDFTKADLSKSSVQMNSTMSFKTFVDKYFMPDYKTRTKSQTYDVGVARLKRLDYFFDRKLSSISPIVIQDWHNYLLEENVSMSYIYSLHQFLQIILNFAEKLGLVSRNNAKVAGNVKRSRGKVDFWTIEEFTTFIQTFNQKRVNEKLMFTVYWFLFFTGLRIGELQALTWKDIDFEEKWVYIHKSIYYRNQKNWEFTDTKTQSSVRKLYLDDDTLKYMREWKEVQGQIGKIDFIFSDNGLPIVKNRVNKMLIRHAEKVNIKPIRVHDLRHSHASLMLQLGMNDLELKNRLGHSDISITLGVYSHLHPTAMRSVADKFNGLVKISVSDSEIS
ncbi:tyrosine-type recombinase/integrase [Lactococcus lactis]|uniref:site-specific integrase n=1 Tax=Lactococcus lactis TaxID=1358 RepID=UPI000C9FCF7D|nr:tyrosine-type recombinase/integrase [Lactococcus lactis]AUS70657.1 site-specific integrase [Lactococcus lactis subsp. lactis]